MAVALGNFSDWLDNKLRDLNTDENVFGSYITGILDSDETPDEKNDALQGILSEIVENADSIGAICSEIFEQWSKFKQKEPPPSGSFPIEDVDVKLAKMLESQCLQTTKQRQYTEEERKIREAILSQYSQMTDDEEEGEEHHGEPDGGGGGGGGGAMHKNTNAHNVMQAEKEKRENARVESQKKKEKDKEDREKQKQMKEDKKEKRKTQKGERRR